jgi:hypothetical protein
MSIKDLFNKSRNQLPQTTNKELLENVESTSNVSEKLELKNTFVPQIDYSEPENFTKYGSAYLYYKSAIERIYDFFPYDGSDAEINAFKNKSLPHEKYVFDNLYPKTNGYANFNGSSYISLKGGPHTANHNNLGQLFRDAGSTKRSQANLYETNVYQADNKPSDYGDGTRESNLKCDFQNGVTVEFWLKAPTPSSNSKQTIFHLTNSSGGDLLNIFLSGTSGSPFHVSLDSDSVSIFSNKQIGSAPTTSSIPSWSHYAISFKSASAGIKTEFYVNGRLDSTSNLGTTGVNTLTQKGTIAYIASGSAGYLSASIDEFRFWKTERDAFQIGTNYFTQARGGTNTDTSNTTLGVYYKFNEGTTGKSSIDSIVLDYAGRLTNGTWNGTVSRTLESAIVEAGAAPSEHKDPIIYDVHPSVSSLKEDLEEKGRFYDINNPSKFINYLPSWVIEQNEQQDTSQLEMVSHIIGAYFDKLYLQIQSVADFKQPLYTSSSYKPLTFARHLPQSLGLYTPEIFIDSEIINTIANKTTNFNFETELEDTKNLIYLNLYNNLASIFKSKGTEKSISGILRCFYIDDQIIKLNTYSNKARYELRNNLEQTTKLNKYLNFNLSDNTDAVVYQKQNPSDTANTIGYVSGSGGGGYEFAYGATIEADVTFPYFKTTVDVFNRDFKEVSLFGVVSASVQSPNDTTFISTDNTNFQIFAVRDNEKSKNVYFKLTSSLAPNPFPEITSSVFFGAYNNQDWNLSVSIVPNKSGSLKFVTGSDDYSYTLKFEGYNTILGDTRDSFSLEESLSKTQGENFLKSAKRVYAGAYRQNLTGSLINKSDVLVSGVRYWLKSIDFDSKKQHALDFDNVGTTDSYQNISFLDDNTKNIDVLNKDTLALSWEFGDLTTSDSSGNFYVTDFSSGSALVRENYGWLGNISGYRHSGYGFGFATSSSNIVEDTRINVFKFVDPERTISSDMVSIVDDSQELFGIPEDVVSYHHTLEKSMYSAISDEMLKFFAGAADFNNLIGEPVNRYRMNYKALEKLRQAFFLRVQNVKEVEQYIEYYKWFDDSLGDIIKQLIPASAVVSDNVFDVVESHVLERNKYQSKFPTVEFKAPEPDTPILGIREMTYDWNRSHHPISNSERRNSEYWKNRAIRTNSDVISSGDSTIDGQRDTIIETADKYNSQAAPTLSDENKNTYSGQTYVLRKLSRPYKLNIDRKTNNPRIIKGGVNFDVNKNFGIHRVALHPAGPINTDDGVFVPRNVLLASLEDLAKVEVTDDPPKDPNKKIKRNIKVQSGRDYEDGVGYKNTKSDIVFPFNIISSSIKTGYNKRVDELVSSDFEIVNVHNDVYGNDMEKPMQGPFTEYAVGGLQYRHVSINLGNDSYLTRPEGWKILLGQNCKSLTGAVGMVGADYPFPEANEVGVVPYPVTGAQKAFLYRDMVAKRPVNIRNIRHTTGSTVLGNYNHNYDVVNSVGAYSNPRQFVELQPTLPENTFTNESRFATSVRTILDVNRTNEQHTDFNGDYSSNYLNSALGESIIISKFSAPGGIEVMTRGYQDFRAGEFSVYNSINSRNLTVKRPFQPASSSVVSDTSGIRVFDIHGRDFGLTIHSARHAARFFRDPTLESNPGASYDENPSFHRTHRNSMYKAVSGSQTVSFLTGSSLRNLSGAVCIGANANSSTPGDELFYVGKIEGPGDVNESRDFRSGSLERIKTFGWSFSGWFNVESFPNNAMTLYSHGMDGSGNPTFELKYIYGGSATTRKRFQLDVGTSNAGGRTTVDDFVEFKTNQVTDQLSGSWHHIAATITGSGGSLTTQLTGAIYIDGISQILTQSGTTHDFYTTLKDSLIANYKNFSFLDNIMFPVAIAGDCTTGTSAGRSISGSIDEVSVWTRGLTSIEVNELYNGGKPCDITASNAYTSDTVNTMGWWRFGDGTIDAIDSANPGVYDPGTNAIQNFLPTSGEIMDLTPLSFSSSVGSNPAFLTASNLPGCEQTLVFIDQAILTNRQFFDNLNVRHQIPRSDRQYSWITSSIVHTDSSDPKYAGLMVSAPRMAPASAPYRKVNGGLYEPFFDYVTASGRNGALFQNTTGLNILVRDATGSATNTLGQSTIRKTSLVSTPYPDRLNALITRRGDNYGWNWRAARLQDHPLVIRQKRLNQVTEKIPEKIRTYKAPPVSISGRPALLNIYTKTNTDECGVNFQTNQTVTLKATDNNLRIYVGSAYDNSVGANLYRRFTPFDNVMKTFSKRINWVSYTENIFPSQINSFDNTKTFRDDYDNQYWRNTQDDREILGNTLDNSFDIDLNQSSWVLDAPPDFLTRVDVPNAASLKNLGGGELQNVYSSYHNLISPDKNTLAPAALYSRKHFMGTYKSVVSPSGIKIAQTASLHGLDLTTKFISQLGGEAKWEAGAKAGFVNYEGTTPTFIDGGSEPWFNNYADFKSELKLISKDYAIVPEFRISEKVADYLKSGPAAVGQGDILEIVGTTKNSGDTSFYKDYSNSEFLKEFANVSNAANAKPEEIRLVCKAVTRFNPYKGFYPAQRTVDMVSQFAESYKDSFAVSGLGVNAVSGREAIDDNGTLLRPLLQPLFAPGILYNTIKSGISVDFPIITTPKVNVITPTYVDGGVQRFAPVFALRGKPADGDINPLNRELFQGGVFWDKRLPFETILDPDRHLQGVQAFDMEPHPSASINATASFIAPSDDPTFKKMSNNFFAEIADFFLKDSEYTTLKSGIVQGEFSFESGSVYGARLKIRRSTEGPRTYQNDFDNSGNLGSSPNSGFALNGLRVSSSIGFGTSSIQLPQDPKSNTGFRETFTMYSRPTAFGPAVWGREEGVANLVEDRGALDSLVGYNWAFTPPYYHGESWADLVFYPDHTKTYTLEEMLAEIQVKYLRADKGYPLRELMPAEANTIYSANNINQNAMQLDSVLNIFGIEDIPFVETNSVTSDTTTRNTVVAQRWVIQPKAETPMFNFNDKGVNQITSDKGYSLSPTFASESVPRGMWHQFGNIPEESNKGIFLEIGDIPSNWLQFHPDAVLNNTTYNNRDSFNNGATLYKNMKSLTTLLGFEDTSQRLGEVKDSQSIKEAVVAIPYTTNGFDACGEDSQLRGSEQKQFFGIPKARINAALRTGTAIGDAQTTAGNSIRDLIANVKEYVLPPQFDFVADSTKQPVAMYFFEFEYKFDKDDLCYMWQNLAPREYKKMEQKIQYAAHDLANNELLSATDILENKNLRWMVFKVKQRSMSKYENKIYRQAGTRKFDTQESGYQIEYNWPYDYLSFVEMVNMDTEILMNNEQKKGETKIEIAKNKISSNVNNDRIQEAVDSKIISKALDTID